MVLVACAARRRATRRGGAARRRRGAAAGPRSTTSSTASSTASASSTSAPTGASRCSPRTAWRRCSPTSAALLAGASTVPVNFHLNADEVAYILADSGARVLFVGPETGGDRARRRPGRSACRSSSGGGRRATPTCGRGRTGWRRSSPAEPSPRRRAAAQPDVHVGDDRPAQGRRAAADDVRRRRHDDRARGRARRRARFAAFGTHLVVGPMYHTGPLSGVRLLAAGVPVVVLGRFDAENVLRAIDTHGVETTVMVPTHFVRLLALPEEVRARYDVSSLRLVAHTGASCPIDVKHRMIEWFGPVLQDSYGATEVGTTCTISSEEWLAAPGLGRPGRAAVPRPSSSTTTATRCPPGTEGRLYFEDATGRGIVYPGDPEKTAAGPPPPRRVHARRDRLRHRRRLRLHHRPLQRHDRVGRRQHLPGRGRAGARSSTPRSPTSPSSACPTRTWARRSRRSSCPSTRPTRRRADELIAWCRERLAGYKCPRSVDIVDTVGRTAMGKVNKRELRRPYWEAAAT